MRQREDLCRRLDKKLNKIASQPKEVQKVSWGLERAYQIPKSIATDYLTLRSNIADANDFVLFAFTETIAPDLLRQHFTEMELRKFPKMRYESRKLKFPIRYKMIQVADDQWIGCITAKELIELRDAQVINYNENTQRIMKRIISNGEEHYRIALNRHAVEEITRSFKNNTYIPNTITFNLPMETNYYYDEESGELVITKTEGLHFDILDGYHRYIAISNIYNNDSTFDYSMELRIVQFDENRAKQFIWQEDQKTKMRRVDSDAMNQTSVPNKIMAKLNIDPDFNLAGQISPNNGIINSGEFYLCLNTLYRDEFKKKSQELSTVIRLTSYYKRLINMITEQDPKYLEKWDRHTTMAVTYVAHKQVPDKEVLPTIEKCQRVLGEHPEILSKYQKYGLNKKDFSRLDELMAEKAG